jgi:hypothetical protein
VERRLRFFSQGLAYAALLIAGAFVGAAAGFYSLYYHIVIEPRQREDSQE